MKYYYKHAIVVNRREYESVEANEIWDEFACCDYAVHALFVTEGDNHDGELVIHEDNIHQPVETMIKNFLSGIEFTGADVYGERFIMVIEDRESPYDSSLVYRHFCEDDLYEAIDRRDS